jgi:nucleotide-binding universal stress UspA family protein
MCKTILVPLDGSALAEQALPLAQHCARRAGAALRLLHVHVTYLLKEVGCAFRHYDRQHDEQHVWLEQAYLDRLAHQLADEPSVAVSTAVVLGMPVEGILAEARQQRADLIVMASRQYPRLARIGFGSVADEITRQAPVPVLLVPSRAPVPAPPGEPAPRHILIPLDGSRLAEEVLEPALHLGRHFNVRYTLLRVVKHALADGDDSLDCLSQPVPDPGWAKAHDYLESVAGRLRGRATHVETCVVRGRAADGILWAAGRTRADLIALATRAHGGLKRLLLGSIADHLHRHSPIPVLVHRGASCRREAPLARA